jgi:hypothetical protein
MGLHKPHLKKKGVIGLAAPTLHKNVSLVLKKINKDNFGLK